MRKSTIAGVLIAFSLLAVACGSDEEAAPSTLKIGYAADFSDLGGFADMPASQAANHFVALVNCSGGIDSKNGIDIDEVLSTDLNNCSEMSGTKLEMTVENMSTMSERHHGPHQPHHLHLSRCCQLHHIILHQSRVHVLQTLAE